MPAIQTREGAISCGDTHAAAPGRRVFVDGRPVVVLGDLSQGHGCFPPSPAVEGSGGVFVNGIPVVRAGDLYADHSCDDETHSGRVGVQSTKTFANGG